MASLNKIFSRCFSSKHWLNESNFCNEKRCPTYFPYRPYRRGKGRCHKCGAKINIKVKCVRKSYRQCLVDSIFTESPLIQLLSQKGMVK
jgi:hypothetical protein